MIPHVITASGRSVSLLCDEPTQQQQQQPPPPPLRAPTSLPQHPPAQAPAPPHTLPLPSHSVAHALPQPPFQPSISSLSPPVAHSQQPPAMHYTYARRPVSSDSAVQWYHPVASAAAVGYLPAGAPKAYAQYQSPPSHHQQPPPQMQQLHHPEQQLYALPIVSYMQPQHPLQPASAAAPPSTVAAAVPKDAPSSTPPTPRSPPVRRSGSRGSGRTVNSRSPSPNSQEPRKTRRYSCHCGKSFTTSGHLARHTRIHTGEKNYVCPEEGCGARFSRQDNCMQHFRTHQVATSAKNGSVSSASGKAGRSKAGSASSASSGTFFSPQNTRKRMSSSSSSMSSASSARHSSTSSLPTRQSIDRGYSSATDDINTKPPSESALDSVSRSSSTSSSSSFSSPAHHAYLPPQSSTPTLALPLPPLASTVRIGELARSPPRLQTLPPISSLAASSGVMGPMRVRSPGGKSDVKLDELASIATSMVM
ncbi:hypothetical protein BZA70DRAFT_278401 [Myxozyma melibiosi]|uniref:C2H2-type domain-containing protein n=1 Tax=Myxozyma melibiosi TaxID=54550 RepID=A0ABR1F6W4_9ASCO